MPTTYYHTVDGEIQGETTAGVRTDYLTDGLGSVVATVNSSAQVVNTYRYKPSGERLAKTGNGADPKFGWTGSGGSRTNVAFFANQYNRSRHLSPVTGAWGARDLLWPFLAPYSYAFSNPVTLSDPTGLEPIHVTINAFIDSKKWGQRVSLMPFLNLYKAFVPFPLNRAVEASSVTDRVAYDRSGSNRGRFVAYIDSEGIGLGAPAVKSFVGETHMFLRLLDYSTEIRGGGHRYIMYLASGFSECVNSWVRVHMRYCAMLLPNHVNLCIDHKYTVVFTIAGEDRVTVEVKDMTLDRFPATDSWIDVGGQGSTDLFFEPDGDTAVHPFLGMASPTTVANRAQGFIVKTPPGCCP